MTHIWVSHGAHVDESRHTHAWVMPHMWMSHGTHMNATWHTYEGVMAHIWMSHVTRMHESCRTCEWVTAHMWIHHGTHMNKSWHTYGWVTSHTCTSPAAHIHESFHWSCGSSNMSRRTRRKRHSWIMKKKTFLNSFPRSLFLLFLLFLRDIFDDMSSSNMSHQICHEERNVFFFFFFVTYLMKKKTFLNSFPGRICGCILLFSFSKLTCMHESFYLSLAADMNTPPHTQTWIMSHTRVYPSCHVTHSECVISHTLHESCYTLWMSHVAHSVSVMSHTLNESCRTFWMSHVAHKRNWMSHIGLSCRIWRLSISHVTHSGWVMSHTYMRVLSHTCNAAVPQRIHACDMTQPSCDMTHPSMRHDSLTCITRRGGGLGSSTIFNKFNEPYALS